MDTIYCDWSIRNGVATVRNDEDEVKFYPDLAAVIETRPERIILETTFQSFDLSARAATIAACERLGIELLTTPNRLTSRFRKAAGLGEKSDPTDARAIRIAAQSGVHLKRPRIAEPGEDASRITANGALMYLRSHGDITKKPRSEGYNFHSRKDDWARELVEYLPPYSSLTDTQKIALGNGKEYSLVTVAAVGMAAYHARNTREFDRLSGLYAHAYPSQIRADLHHHAWAGGNTRAHLNGAKEDGIRKRDDITLSQFRREMRWLYHQLADVVRKVKPVA